MDSVFQDSEWAEIGSTNTLDVSSFLGRLGPVGTAFWIKGTQFQNCDEETWSWSAEEPWVLGNSLPQRKVEARTLSCLWLPEIDSHLLNNIRGIKCLLARESYAGKWSWNQLWLKMVQWTPWSRAALQQWARTGGLRVCREIEYSQAKSDVNAFRKLHIKILVTQTRQD